MILRTLVAIRMAQDKYSDEQDDRGELTSQMNIQNALNFGLPLCRCRRLCDQYSMLHANILSKFSR